MFCQTINKSASRDALTSTDSNSLLGTISMNIYNTLLSSDKIHRRYAIRYMNFIESRPKNRNLKYSEQHHILPRSLYPEFEDEPLNLISLTAKEHYIAHHLLYKAFPKSYSMLRAFWGMCNGWQDLSTQHRYTPQNTSRTYSELRKHVAIEMSKRMSEHNPYTQQKIKDRIIEKHGGLGNSSDTIFAKQKQTMIEKFGTDNYFKLPEFILGIAERNRNAWKDSDVKEKRIANMKIGLMNRPILKCPHCGKESKSNSNMKRYHFDNCKFTVV